jgi:lysozyme
MTRAIPQQAVDFIKGFEGRELTAYLCPAGVLTVGYGHTGPDVTPGLKITNAQAEALLRQDLGVAAARLESRIGPVVDELSEPQFCALLSFVLNLGANEKWSIWKVLKGRQFDQVPSQLMRFVNAGGKPLKGLVRRRTAECELWHADASDEVVPSAVTRATPTPPTPSDTKPLSQSKSFMTGAATTIVAATTAVGEVSKAVSPFAAQSEVVAHLVSTLALIAAGLAVATLLFVYLKKRSAS